MQFVILGTGDHHYEQWFMEAARRHPEQMAAMMRLMRAYLGQEYMRVAIFF